jgi:hypothetical protein
MNPRLVVAAMVVVGLLVIATPAAAQQYVLGGGLDVMAGLEGGGSGYASGIRRTRTSLRVAAEAHVDEFPKDMAALGLLIELEPRGSVGADLRYMRQAGEKLRVNIGATGVVAPKHMLGATFGADYRISFGEGLAFAPSVTGNVYFVGSDLSGPTVIWQLNLGVGARFAF